MKGKIVVLLLLAAAGKVFAQCVDTSNRGIFVEPPKVYDDYFLESQLTALKTRLASINGTDQTTLISKLGQTQGATMSQSALSIQAMGPGTSGISTLTPPAPPPVSASGSTPTPNYTASGAYGTTTTGPTLSPSVPTAPTSTLAMPSTFSPSSLDTLNEEMQLSSQIINLELLLDGSLNDRFITGSQQPKRRVTVGINISINPCLDNSGWGGQAKKLLKDHLAEIEVEVQNPPGSTSSEAPSIMTLLPRDKTYNVASLSSNSISAGAGGVLSGVLSIGGGWFWNKQKYYLVQQQDTVAIEESPSKFLWQFRPVLGQDFLHAGTRQNFVQFSLPENDNPSACQATLLVSTRWRKLDAKTGLIGGPEQSVGPISMTVNYIDISDTNQLVTAEDIGGGFLDVKIAGAFQEGVQVRIGSSLLASGSPYLRTSYDTVEFTATAKDIIAADGAYLINRDGGETQIMTGSAIPHPKCGAAPAPVSVADPGHAAISSVKIMPYSDTQSLLSFTFTENQIAPASRNPHINPILVSFGNQVFGLQNAPYRDVKDLTVKPAQPEQPEAPASWAISMVVPSDALRASPNFVVRRLFVPGDLDAAPIPLGNFPKVDFAITGLTAITLATKANPSYELLVTGSGLDQATLSAPSCASVDTAKPKASSFAFITLTKDCKDSAKVLVFSFANALPAVIAIPSLDAAGPAKPKAPIDPLKATAAPGASSITVTGSGLDQIASIKFGKARLSLVVGLDKKSAVVTLTPDITSSEGIRYLDIATIDGKTSRFELTIKKP